MSVRFCWLFARRVFACDLNARDMLSEHEATSQFGPEQIATCVPSGRRVVSKIYAAKSSALPIRTADRLSRWVIFRQLGRMHRQRFADNWVAPCNIIGRTAILD